MKLATLALLFVAACGPDVAPVEAPGSDDVFMGGPPPALPGTELVRLSVRDAEVGRRFGATSPWLLEVHLPPGVVVPGRGLPPPPTDPSLDPAEWSVVGDDSVLQVELPLTQDGRTDEEASYGAIGSFERPLFCTVRDPGCPYGADTDGRWRAARVRDTGSGTLVRELQLARVTLTDAAAADPAYRLLTVWMDPSQPPLDAQDRILLGYVGHLPRRSTDWLPEPDDVLRPRVRYRPAPADTAGTGADCPASDPACWTVVPPAEVQGLRLRGGPIATLDVVTPLDGEVGQPFEISVTARDARRNPTRVTGDVTVTLGILDLGVLSFQDEWQRRLTVVPPTAGNVSMRARHGFAAEVVYHWARIWGVGERRFQRSLGDVHMHTGVDGDLAFLNSWLFGDHRGQFTRSQDALRWLQEVERYDFGALSEHSYGVEGWSLPATGFDAFRPGGPCEVSGSYPAGIGDWWTDSQRISRQFEAATTGFATFPAFEWHGRYRDLSLALDARLHRVVLFRDHDGATPDGLPILPGNVANRPPHCLVHYLEQAGRVPEDTLVIPHMMQAQVENLDWDLTFRGDPVFEALVADETMNAFATVGEIFSARAYAAGTDRGVDLLAAFEGRSPDPSLQPWSFRYGWRDTEAVLGVIGSSDTHSGMPGTDDPFTVNAPRAHEHDPTGTAVVLADVGAPPRDGIFDGLRARRTYATSGVRAWLDLGVVVNGTVHRMGSEVGAVTRCRVTGRVELMAGRRVRAVEIWGTEVGSAAPYRKVFDAGLVNRERVDLPFTLSSPVGSGGRPERWVYTLRAFTGDDVVPSQTAEEVAAGHEDAIWASPIWIDWQAPGCR